MPEPILEQSVQWQKLFAHHDSSDLPRRVGIAVAHKIKRRADSVATCMVTVLELS